MLGTQFSPDELPAALDQLRSLILPGNTLFVEASARACMLLCLVARVLVVTLLLLNSQ